ncbi:MAG: hypothetical protein FWC41_10380 [Firmicutes bacterium]|nr:hypothetical protein [Bacillota bacterium]
MKKFLSVFLGSLLSFSSICSTAFAGGVDKEEILSDGTRLIYISTERIPEVLEHYMKKRKALLDARYSTNQSFSIKVIASALGAAGFYTSSKLEKTYPNVALCGKFISVFAALLAFFYPNYVDYKLGREYCGWDTRKSHQCYITGRYITGQVLQWGPADYINEGFGVDGICRGLRSHYYESGSWNPEDSNWNPKIKDIAGDSGVVIILRPKSKWGISNTVHSKVCSQKAMATGTLRLLKHFIKEGK